MIFEFLKINKFNNIIIIGIYLNKFDILNKYIIIIWVSFFQRF